MPARKKNGTYRPKTKGNKKRKAKGLSVARVNLFKAHLKKNAEEKQNLNSRSSDDTHSHRR